MERKVEIPQPLSSAPPPALLFSPNPLNLEHNLPECPFLPGTGFCGGVGIEGLGTIQGVAGPNG
jgi:hypothetical protein